MTKKNHGYENANIHVELREKNQQIVPLKKRYVGYLANEDKSSGTTIIAKSNEEAKYPYISISLYIYLYIYIYKVRVLLAQKKGSTLFAERYTPNSIVLYNFWREHRLIVVDPNKSIHFRLDATNREQL